MYVKRFGWFMLLTMIVNKDLKDKKNVIEEI